MRKKFNDILDLEPTVFQEDVYLCNGRGEVITSRAVEVRDLKNLFTIISADDVKFIKKNMSFSGFRPLFVVDSARGPIIVDLSLAAKFRLLIVIFPHFDRAEILGLVKGALSFRVTASESIKRELESLEERELSEDATTFADRVLAVRRAGEYYSWIFKTNLEAFHEICDIAESFGRFYGCRFSLSYNNVQESIEPRNKFCFESCAFAMVSLAFLARNYSANRGASVDVHLDDMGFYFDVRLDIAEQYDGERLDACAPELKNLMARGYESMFDCFHMQREGTFIVRALLWLRTPDSADLKEKHTKFIYDYDN